jgi:hypothetical protein
MRTARTLKLELLRHGPSHNQLLSPLTPYLALCGNHGAGTLHLPLEHREFLLRMRPLSYLPGQEEAEIRGAHLREMGRMLSDLLAKVPGFGTELGARTQDRDELVHLQLVTSAAELALLPFEAALSPLGMPGAGAPLALQTEVPLSITRQVRRASAARVEWPRRPRILVAIASPPGLPRVPALAHVTAMQEAIAPWLRPVERGGRLEDNTRELLTVLPRASLAGLREACSRHEYTHVHILAHGHVMQESAGPRYGLAFHHDTQPDQQEFITGEELASALRGHQAKDGRLSHPAVVTVASCDSGRVGNIMVPGGSLAHALHEDGIPFVVASQFPLTFMGSVVLTRVLYTQLLWGLDPRVILHDVRQQLRLLGESILDWASVVAYAALPPDFDAQLAAVQFERSKQAANAALARAEPVGGQVSPAKLDRGLKELSQAKERLLLASPVADDPGARHIRAEIQGLCGSIDKRLAYNRYRHMRCPEVEGGGGTDAQRVERLLERACEHYRRGFHLEPTSSWMATQYIALRAIQWVRNRKAPGRDKEELFPHDWYASARLLCEFMRDAERRDDRAWAHSNLAELCLLEALRLHFEPPADARREGLQAAVAEAVSHVKRMTELAGGASFHVHSTREQFKRYTEWWFAGDEELKELRGLIGGILEAFPEERSPLADEESLVEAYVR